MEIGEIKELLLNELRDYLGVDLTYTEVKEFLKEKQRIFHEI